MSFLDKPLSEMSLADLQRLISVEVSAQIPAIPTGVRNLGNLDVPLVKPDVATNNQVLTYTASLDAYVAKTVTTGIIATDAGTPGAPTLTLVPGPGWIQAKWTLPSGTVDPLEYDVFCRALADPTIADGTYLVGTTTALSLVINKLADGTQLADVTTYHVIVRPKSILSGGAVGTASADVNASPAAIDASVTTISNLNASNITTGTLSASVIGANTITAGKLVVGTITLASGVIGSQAITADNMVAGTITATSGVIASLDAGVITTGTLNASAVTIQTANAGTQRVVIGAAGIQLYDAANTLIVNIPTDAAQSSSFKGNIVTGSIQITGNLLLQGATNNMDKGSTLTLNQQLASPNTAPTLATDVALTVLTGGGTSTFAAMDYDGAGGAGGATPSLLTVEAVSGKFRLREYVWSTKAFNRDVDLSSLVGITHTICGVGRCGTSVYILHTPDAGVTTYITSVTQATFVTNVRTTVVITGNSNNSTQNVPTLAMCSDGSQLLVFNWVSTSSSSVKQVTAVSQAAGVPTVGAANALTGGLTRGTGSTGNLISAATARDGTNWVIVTVDEAHGGNSAAERYIISTKTLGAAAGDTWYPDLLPVTPTNANKPTGITWDQAANYWTCSSFVSGNIRQVSNWTWTTPNNRWWAAYSWLTQTDFAAGVTISIATPAVVTQASHGLVANQEVFFTTTGTLPSHITANTSYFVLAAGLAAGSFEIAATPGGAAINTTGDTQSGTHTLHYYSESVVSPLANTTLDGSNPLAGGATSAQVWQRGRLLVTVPTFPATVGHARLYLINQADGSAAPATTALKLAAATTYVTADTTTSFDIINANASGQAPPTANNYTGSTSNILATATAWTAAWKLGGDGTFQLPTVALANLPSGTAGMMGAITHSEHAVVWYDGTAWRVVDGPENGLTELRRALFRAAGSSAMTVRATNYDPLFCTTGAPTGMATGTTRYMAVYWPGGACTGMYYVSQTAGSYTDANKRSSVALYSYDGTTMTHQAHFVNPLTTSLYTGTGLQSFAWTGGAVTLAAGIYYVAMRYVQSAVVTAPVWGATPAVVDPSLLAANNAVTPTAGSKWPLVFIETDATQTLITTTFAASGLGTTATNLNWVGLY